MFLLLWTIIYSGVEISNKSQPRHQALGPISTRVRDFVIKEKKESSLIHYHMHGSMYCNGWSWKGIG
jgi:hypothetical protein